MKLKTAAAIFVGLVLAGTAAAETVAVVNGRAVTQAEFDIYASRFQGEITEEQRARLLTDIIDVYILAEEAKKQALEKEPNVAANLELQTNQILAGAMLNNHLENNPVTDEDLRAAYERSSNSADDGVPEYKASHILVESEADAVAIIRELNAGADFAKLAEEKSTDSSARNGGDLGWFPAQAMVRPFANAVVGLKTGAYSPSPIKTQFGYHVILLEDTRVQSFDKVKENYRNAARQQKVQGFVEGLRSAAKIER